MTEPAWSMPHQDGSKLYVPEPNPRLDGKVAVRLRAPRAGDVSRAWVRVLADGEPELVPAAVLGSGLVGLAGTADLQVRAGGLVTLPAHGPALGMWRLESRR